MKSSVSGIAPAVLAGAASSVAVARDHEVLPKGDSMSWTGQEQAVGFRSIEKIRKVHVIRSGNHALPLPNAPRQIVPRWTWKGQRMNVPLYMKERRTSGVIVLKDGKVVLERYGLGRKPTDGWVSQSVAKSVTSILVGAAVNDGYIKSIEAPVTTYIPELKGSAYEGVSVHNVLTMSSGVKWNEDYLDPNSDVNQFWHAKAEPGVHPTIAYLRRLPREAEPGTRFLYNSAETDLAGILLTGATAKSMAEYLSEKLWQPYGMEKDAFWQVDPSGQEHGGCCISATLRDFARIGQFMLEGGRIGEQSVLPSNWLQQATSAQVIFPPDAGKADNRSRIGYGYFWWIYPNAFSASGIFGQSIYVCPKDKVVIAINSAWPKPTDPEYSQAREAFAEALRAAAVAQDA